MHNWVKSFFKENYYFHAAAVSRDIKGKSRENKGMKSSETFFPICEYLASNCQPGLEGYLVKCIPIFTFACKKVVIDLLLSYS